MRQTALSALLLVLAACGSNPSGREGERDAETDSAVDTSTEQDASPDAELDATPDAPTDLGPIDAGLLPVQTLCEAACNERASSPDGLCEFSVLPCAEACVTRAPEDEALFDAYLSCVTSDPLCFQTLLQCVVTAVLPDPFAHVVTLEGSGFEGYVGQRLYASIEENGGRQVRTERLIDAPTFTQELEVFMLASQSHLVLWFVDVDEDGACTPGTDLTGTSMYDAWMRDEAPIALPDWRIPVSPNPEIDARFVCDFL